MVEERAGFAAGRSSLAAGAVAACVVAGVLVSPTTASPAPIADPVSLLTSATAALDLLAPEAAELADTALSGTTASLGEGIQQLYLTLEPWAQYGVDVMSWAVGWVPVVGLLAPQINFFYTLGESITQSLVFNTTDLLDGTIDSSQAQSSINSATVAAFNAFVDTETSWIRHLLPPPPPSLPAPPPGVDAPEMHLRVPDPGAPGDVTPELGEALPDLGL